MAVKKYATLNTLSSFLDNLKNLFATKTEMSAKANKSHSHSISDIDNLQTALDTKTNQNAFSNVKIDNTTISADIITDTLTLVAGNNITITPDVTNDKITISSIDTNTTYSAGTGISLSGTTFSNSGVRSVSTGSSNGTISVNTNGTTTNVAVKGLGSAAYTASTAYDAAGAANNALASAKTYADNAANAVKNDLLNGAGEAYNTLKELGDLIDDNTDAIDALEVVAAGKANKTHTHAISDVTNLQSNLNGIQAQLDGKAASSHTHSYAGSSSAGGAATSANKVNSTLTVKLNGGATEGTNLFTFNGSAAKSINITPSAIGAASSSHTHDDRYYTETEVDSKLSGKANTSHGNHVPITQTANNATFLRNDNTWQKVTPTNIGAAASSHTHKVANITDLTATATELNYMDGVTSNVQTQLDGKAASSHNHSASNITSGTLSSDRLPTVPITKGGTGATTAAAALTNLGITATASELNKLDGVTATTTELNYVDGVTSNIQTQLNGKAASSHTHNKDTINSVYDTRVTWGGESMNGSVSPIGVALSSEHSANRIAYLNPNALAFEYSDNGGSSWTAMSIANSTKIGFVTTSGTISIGNASTVTTNHRTRVTLTAQNGTTGYVYTRPRKLLLNVSSAGHGISVTIETKTGVSGASWTTVGTYPLSGWSGWNDIPLSFSTLGGGTTQTSNIWYMRLTFATTSVSSGYTTTKSTVIGMRLFGDTCWTRTSNMGETGHLYSYDTEQNAIFPASISGSGSLSMNRKSGTSVGSYSIAVGQDCEASGAGSFAEGGMTVASGRYSHAEGHQSKATATYAHAEGVNTTASNMYSHAEGNTTTASGMGCHAEGCETTASGINTHAEGLGTQATSNGDHAEGGYTKASGVFSHAEGYYTEAASNYQHVQGQYNVVDKNNTYLHIVGNGESESARSNAHTLDRSGNAWYAGKIASSGLSWDAFKSSHGTSNEEAGFTAERTDTGTSVRFGVGAAGVNHGVYSDTQGRWLIHGNATDIYIGGYKAYGENLLYNNTSGNASTVTLSDTAANYTYLEIFYMDNNSREYQSVKIFAPNGKTTDLSVVEASSTTSTIIRRTRYTISGKTITPDITNAGYLQLYHNGNTPKTSFGTNYIRIVRVVGLL